jgi:hypothetical protein
MFFEEHAQWLMVALVIICVVAALTMFSFWRKRYADRGPKKGVPNDPKKVRRQNPPDHA